MPFLGKEPMSDAMVEASVAEGDLFVLLGDGRQV